MIDWSDAYANAPYIPDAESYPDRWAKAAEHFRTQGRWRDDLDFKGGSAPRQQMDIFMPRGRAKGTTVFVHGGYWMSFDRKSWSHLAQGPLMRGWIVAFLQHTLAPERRIGGITQEIAEALYNLSTWTTGPIRLAGHSAGGHLVTRMACTGIGLPQEVLDRIEHVVSISGLHDLRPLQFTRMNETLQLDDREACDESPALQVPHEGMHVTAWVGAQERPEFLRQSALIANIWHGLGAHTQLIEAPDRHHFNVIDDLIDPDSALTRLVAP